MLKNALFLMGKKKLEKITATVELFFG